MKVLKLLSCALATVCAAAIITPASAFAAEQPTEYPQSNFDHVLSFTEGGITDFAINGDTYAFASGTTVYRLYKDVSGDYRLDDSVQTRSAIEQIEYCSGELYVYTAAGNTFVYPNMSKTVTPEENPFTQNGKTVMLADSSFYVLTNEALKYFYFEGGELKESAFTTTDVYKIKAYSDIGYAVLDDELYKLNRSSMEKVILSYTDFSAAAKIPVNDLKTNLKTQNYDLNNSVAKLKKDAYYTRINLDATGSFFESGETVKADDNTQCVVLYKGEKTAIIANDDGCFITANENFNSVIYQRQNDWKPNGEGVCEAFTLQSTGLYSAPYISESTKRETLKSGAKLVVTDKFKPSFSSTTFYRVEYTQDEETKTGFVAAGYLSEYNFQAVDNSAQEEGRESFNYDTNVVTVTLIIVIVALVMIAVLYLSFASDKKKRGKRVKQLSQHDEPQQETEE